MVLLICVDGIFEGLLFVGFHLAAGKNVFTRCRIEADDVAVFLNDREAVAVDRCDLGCIEGDELVIDPVDLVLRSAGCGTIMEAGGETLLHLGSGGFGKGDRKDAADRNPVVQTPLDETCHKDTCLASTGGSADQDAGAGRIDGFLLFVIEACAHASSSVSSLFESLPTRGTGLPMAPWKRQMLRNRQ